MLMTQDVLDVIRKKAKERFLPYQTYINQVLRDIMIRSSEEDRIRQIVCEEPE